jgi:hypothetical protein
MGKVYKNQTKLSIKLDTGVDCSTAISTTIGYRKPDGTLGEWTATVDTDDTTLVYSVQSSNDIDAAGIWSMWTKVVFADSNVAWGEPITEKIYEVGS